MAEEKQMSNEGVLKAVQIELQKFAAAMNARFEALKQVVYNYLEAGSSMALAGVKAQLKSV